MGKEEERRRKEYVNKLAYRLARRALDYTPQRANISAISRLIGTTVAKLWFYVHGDAKWPADEFLRTLVALDQLEYIDGNHYIRLHLTDEESDELWKIREADIAPTRSSSISGIGAFDRADDTTIHP